MKDTFMVIVLCAAIALGASAAYRHICVEWVSYRQAENYLTVENYQEAAQAYREALDHGLNEPGVFFGLVKAELALDQGGSAAETATRFSKSGATDSVSMYAMAELFVAKGMFGEAASILEPLVRDDPENRIARFRLAQVLTWSRNFDEAILHYNRILGETP